MTSKGTNTQSARDLYQAKQKAMEYYSQNGVPQKMETILNSMFLDNPDDVYGHLVILLLFLLLLYCGYIFIHGIYEHLTKTRNTAMYMLNSYFKTKKFYVNYHILQTYYYLNNFIMLLQYNNFFMISSIILISSLKL